MELLNKLHKKKIIKSNKYLFFIGKNKQNKKSLFNYYFNFMLTIFIK